LYFDNIQGRKHAAVGSFDPLIYREFEIGDYYVTDLLNGKTIVSGAKS